MTFSRANNILMGAVAAVLLAAVPLSAWAHADLLLMIDEVSAQIRGQPTNAELYLRRGELHRVHTNWDSAQADFDRALALNPGLAIVELARGKMFLEAGWPLSAKTALDRFVGRQPNHSEGLATRARILALLDQNLAAADDYTLALAHSAESRPELYLERAQVLVAEGGPHLETALQGLEEGVRKIGPLVTLQLFAIDLEIKLNRFDSALVRLDRVAAQSPRKESWLERRGQILRLAGREAEAREAFQAALIALNSLPESRRRVPAMTDLEKRLRQALEPAAPGVKPGEKAEK